MARQVGFPVALKLASRTIVQKTEVGGLYLNFSGENEVWSAFAELRQKLSTTAG